MTDADKIRQSREFQICIDPDEQRLIDAMLRLVEDLQAEVDRLSAERGGKL